MYIATKETETVCKLSVVVGKHKECSCAYHSPLYMYIIIIGDYCTIIESVDSSVGIARTRNIWQYIQISPNLKNGQLISVYDNIPSIFECSYG